MTRAFAASGSHFTNFVAIDWSGAIGLNQPGIAIAWCGRGDTAPTLVREDRCWSRPDVLAWLRNELPADCVIGMDLGMALPFIDCGGYFPGWTASPPDARALWALVDALCADAPGLAATPFVDHPVASAYFRRHGQRTGAAFGTGRGRLRVTERHQQRHGSQGLNPYSNFNLVGAAQVGKSSLTGMRLLHQLDGCLPIWPFDRCPTNGSVIVEIYTTIAAVAGGLPKGRSKMRSAAVLDTVLAQLGSQSHRPLVRYDDHRTDAIASAAWLRSVASDPSLWHPAVPAAVLATEGWTFGIR